MQVPVDGRHAGGARPETGSELRDRKKVVVNGGARRGHRCGEGAELGEIGGFEEELQVQRRREQRRAQHLCAEQRGRRRHGAGQHLKVVREGRHSGRGRGCCCRRARGANSWQADGTCRQGYRCGPCTSDDSPPGKPGVSRPATKCERPAPPVLVGLLCTLALYPLVKRVAQCAPLLSWHPLY